MGKKSEGKWKVRKGSKRSRNEMLKKGKVKGWWGEI